MKEQSHRNRSLAQLLRQRFSLITVMLLVIVSAIISGVTVGNLVNRTNRGQADNSLNSGSPFKAAVTTDTTGVVAIAQKAGPSIVGIKTTVRMPLDRYFGGDEKETGAEGSGIIINKDGYIMTNYHVVEYADPRNDNHSQATLEVFLPDKRQAEAKFIGGDRLNDLAVIKINLKNLPVATLGDSSKLKVGALAVAIGNPLGLEFAGSVTAGVISALNRVVSLEDRTLMLIQTDAAINPGNSGGALVDESGKVVGVNTVKITLSGVEGLGFAIPINDAKPIVNQLIKYGYVKGRPLLGISGREITAEMAEYYDLPVGIYIVQVAADSGAAKAGMRRKDILISLAGRKVTSMLDVNNIKKSYKAGDTVKAVVVRNKQKINLKVTFTEQR
ncbi:MAG TPA: trypsin-like peptidase domain-containing protein [Bacillota bacterium]